jgi:murein L,D-transpeptidase YafK
LKRIVITSTLLATLAILVIVALNDDVRNYIDFAVRRAGGEKTVEDRLQQFGSETAARLKPLFELKGIAWPCKELVFIAYKQDRELQVFGRPQADSTWSQICSYPITAASGVLGPKLREGDRQVPEGVYQIESLNANSRYHVSMRLNYPNAYDRAMAERDQRTSLGGDIMIHGGTVSIGCLAVGNDAEEDLFVLAANARPNNVKVIIAPTRSHASWEGELYQQIYAEIRSIQ